MIIEDGIQEFVIDGIDIKVAAVNNLIEEIRIARSGAAGNDCGSSLARYFRDYLHGKTGAFEPALNLGRLTGFQRRVYEAAAAIPFGKTASYQQVAEKIGGKRYARAVGTALSKNPFPIAIPCHRVLPKKAGIDNPGGFAGGTDLKIKLLHIEK
ncbi:MAG: MGMT family protein [Brevinematales bacterium]